MSSLFVMLVAEQQDSQHCNGGRQEPFEYRLPSFNLLKVEDPPEPGDLRYKIEVRCTDNTAKSDILILHLLLLTQHGSLHHAVANSFPQKLYRDD